MRPACLLAVLYLITAPGYVETARAQGADNKLNVSQYRALLDQYCISCHNERLRTGDLVLDTIDLAHIGDTAEIWEKVVRKLRSGLMPPSPRPQPNRKTSDSFRGWLENELDRAATEPDPGRIDAFHRLNRTEYHNAVRDLLDLEVDISALLPADAIDQHGFDNNAGELSVSPALLERYVLVAGKVSRLAVGLERSMVISTYPVPLNLVQDGQQSEDLPFASRGGIAIRHTFPVDGEYQIKIRLQRNYVNYIRGLESTHEVDVRLDGRRVKQFEIGGDAPGTPAPLSFAGNISGDPEWENYMHVADEGLEISLSVEAGPRIVGVTFPRELWEQEGVLQPRQSGFALAVNEILDGNPSVGNVEISGPYAVNGPGDTPSRRRIFVCRPGAIVNEEQCAREILSALAHRAYRRPVTDADLDTLMSFYEAGGHDASFDAGIQLALERLLTDPEFLFRIERDPPDVSPSTAYRISPLEFASRLSFFLWSSIPDEELLELAASGELGDPVVQEQQVKRMLADPRAQALVDNFAGQWLYLRNAQSIYPNPDEFPEFDENLRTALRRETELFVESMLHEDRSMLDLLTANYTFLNERLAKHYGIPHIYGNRFRRVTLADENRRGLLGHGSLMTVTSYPNRTSPVVRGKWIMENLLGTPPPEPPPNVPTLEEKNEEGKELSMRAAMVRHRRNPACSACHAPMDPLGFALENFNAIGGWRTMDGPSTIDASGAFPDGVKFEGPSTFREALGAHNEQFVGVVVERLLTYALGRGAESFDKPAIRKIATESAQNNHRWSSIILGIVKSIPFQMRSSAS